MTNQPPPTQPCVQLRGGLVCGRPPEHQVHRDKWYGHDYEAPVPPPTQTVEALRETPHEFANRWLPQFNHQSFDSFVAELTHREAAIRREERERADKLRTALLMAVEVIEAHVPESIRPFEVDDWRALGESDD